jgi:hypothetical protein
MNDEQQSTQTSPAPRGSGARAATIALAVFGGVVLLGAGGTAALAATHDVRDAARHGGSLSQSQAVDVDGIRSLRLNIAASDVTARFGDVDQATLEVLGSGRGNWKLDRRDDELIVSSPDRGFGWWFDTDWFGDETVVLTLPESLNDGRLDADITLSAGNLDIEGDYDELDIEMGAGALQVDGSATSIEANVNAGRADVNLTDVSEADFTLSAGKIVAELTGSTPSTVAVDVSAGSLELTVPDDVYQVTQDVSAGSLDNRLDTSSQSSFTIDASVSAGSVVLRSGR